MTEAVIEGTIVTGTVPDAIPDQVPDAIPDQAVTLEFLDPKKIIGKNIRLGKADRQLLDSVRRRGNHTPIGVLRTPDGDLVLRFGDRRRQACIETGRRVLAVVINGTTGTPEAETERIFLQLDENRNREPLTAADHAVAIAALFDLGVGATEISRQTGLGKKDLDAARKIAVSETARTLAGQYPLDLGQTADLADFENEPDAVKALIAAAQEGKGRFAHVLQQARDNRADREAITAHTVKLAERGITVTSQRQSYENNLREWAAADGTRLTPETHEKCPGNVVSLYAGHGHEVQETWYCTDPRGNGHKHYRDTGASGQSPEEAAERKKVLAGNKAWRSAEEVRLDWLRGFLARPRLPDGARRYVLEALARADGRLRRAMDHGAGGQHATARRLLGLPEGEGSSWNRAPEVLAAIRAAGPVRAEVIALAVVLGAYEGSTSVQSWRTPDTETASYLETLAGWGYELSDIEQELVTAVRSREAGQAAVAQQDQAEAERES